MSYSNGRRYGGRIWGERIYDKKRSEDGSQSKLLEVFMSKELKILGCWLSKYSYPRIGYDRLHIKFAEGTGEIVRHLCGCNRCFNPLHIVRGSDIENTRDETEFESFGVDILSKILGERYAGMTIHEEFITLKSKAARVDNDKFGNFYDMIREEYRRLQEIKLATICKERIDYLREKFFSLFNFMVIKENRE